MSDTPLINVIRSMTQNQRLLSVGGQDEGEIWITVAQLATRVKKDVDVVLGQVRALANTGEVILDGRDFSSIAGQQDPALKNVPCVKLSAF